jgi:hypothetical protein
MTRNGGDTRRRTCCEPGRSSRRSYSPAKIIRGECGDSVTRIRLLSVPTIPSRTEAGSTRWTRRITEDSSRKEEKVKKKMRWIATCYILFQTIIILDGYFKFSSNPCYLVAMRVVILAITYIFNSNHRHEPVMKVFRVASHVARIFANSLEIERNWEINIKCTFKREDAF